MFMDAGRSSSMAVTNSNRKIGGAFALSLLIYAASVGAAELLPEGEPGRYSMLPVSNGVVRLDTRTGEVSTCSKTESGWACRIMPDEHDALDTEIGRLQAENDKLRAELAARETKPGSPTDKNPAKTAEKAEEALPKADLSKKPEIPKPETAAPEPSKPGSGAGKDSRKIEIPLPSDADMDRVISLLARAWRRLVEMANRMQGDSAGKI